MFVCLSVPPCRTQFKSNLHPTSHTGRPRHRCREELFKFSRSWDQKSRSRNTLALIYGLETCHLQSGVVYNFGGVCLSGSNTTTFESLDVRSFFRTSGISPEDRDQVRMWRSSGQSQGHMSRRGWKCVFPQCKTSIGNNSGSIKSWRLRATWGFRLGGWNGVTAILVTRPAVTTRN